MAEFRIGGERVSEVDDSRRLDALDVKGNWVYPSTAGSGYEKVDIPALAGSPNPVEQVSMRDFPRHVIGKVEAAFGRQGYIKTGATQSAPEVLAHYSASSRGAQLLDPASQSRLDSLVREFSNAPNRTEYYQGTVRPFLEGLEPGRR